jgi:hypothetical protein
MEHSNLENASKKEKRHLLYVYSILKIDKSLTIL